MNTIRRQIAVNQQAQTMPILAENYIINCCLKKKKQVETVETFSVS